MEADHCSETTRRRSADGYEGRGCPPGEKHKLFDSFSVGEAYRGGEAARQRLQHPAAASVGSKHKTKILRSQFWGFIGALLFQILRRFLEGS